MKNLFCLWDPEDFYELLSNLVAVVGGTYTFLYGNE